MNGFFFLQGKFYCFKLNDICHAKNNMGIRQKSISLHSKRFRRAFLKFKLTESPMETLATQAKKVFIIYYKGAQDILNFT